MPKKLKVSIIIPLYVDSERFFNDIKKFKKLNYSNYEILIVSDKKIKLDNPKARLILTNKKRTGPAEKRDIAIKEAKGEVCAFIDDDAYPDKYWLDNATIHFNHPQIAAVGGPGITPKEDGYLEQITGLVYESFFCGGHAQHRFVKKPIRFVVDYPAYNLLVRKSILKEVGGYGTHFYGGEDTFLCLKIIKKGYKILYDPDVVVYHHRRKIFIPYLKQIANIGKHRGYFAKKFPETSKRLSYALPTILTIGFMGGFVLSFFSKLIFSVFLILSFIFLLMAFLSVVRKASIINSLLIAITVILTHLVYGSFFISGLVKKDLLR